MHDPSSITSETRRYTAARKVDLLRIVQGKLCDLESLLAGTHVHRLSAHWVGNDRIGVAAHSLQSASCVTPLIASNLAHGVR
jgi:hypothetical protein